MSDYTSHAQANEYSEQETMDQFPPEEDDLDDSNDSDYQNSNSQEETWIDSNSEEDEP